jgi:hypothetical protein
MMPGDATSPQGAVGRLKRLDELIDRLDSLEPIELRSEFDGREWISEFTNLQVKW